MAARHRPLDRIDVEFLATLQRRRRSTIQNWRLASASSAPCFERVRGSSSGIMRYPASAFLPNLGGPVTGSPLALEKHAVRIASSAP